MAYARATLVEGSFRPAANNEKYPALVKVDSVAGMSPDDARNRPKFENLTPLFPDQKLALEIPGDPANVTARIVDLISPIGKGQRGLIVSPPKAGKTTVLKQIAHSIEANNPDVHLMVLLVDERPEEVTDMRRSVKGEVIASTFDRPADEHTQVSELAIERAKRLVESGRDVVIVLDGITRLARAYNLAQPATGRIMSGGIDTGALYPPKKFFGSAATSKKAARSRSWRPHWWRPGAGWTRSSSRSSRAQATWSCASTASSPNGASTRRSTSMHPPPATKSCSSTANSSSRSGSCAGS